MNGTASCRPPLGVMTLSDKCLLTFSDLGVVTSYIVSRRLSGTTEKKKKNTKNYSFEFWHKKSGFKILTKLEVKIKIFQKSMKYRGKLQRFGAKVQVVGDFQLLWKFPKFGIFGLQKRVFLL